MDGGSVLVKTGMVLRRAGGVPRFFGRLLLDTLYPPLCLNCEAPVGDADALCAACFRQLRPITAPYCPRLGLPFQIPLGPDALSAEAIADPPPFDRARSAVIYNDVARAIVARMKYGDRPELARALARLTGLAVDPSLVRRVRRTRQQVGLSAEARVRNVAGAFAAHPEVLARSGGRPIVIVDDVITTGSTVKSITRALGKAGVAHVDVVSFARVVPGFDS